MNLPLTRYHCTRLLLASESNLPMVSESDLRSLIGQTINNLDEAPTDGEHFGLFLSQYRVEEQVCQAVGRLRFKPSQDGLSVRLLIGYETSERALLRKGIRIRSIFTFIRHVSELLGSVSLECISRFEYDRKQGFDSRITLPAPLTIPEGADGLTHIEAAEFSRRDANGLQYGIGVSSDEENSIFRHDIHFSSTLQLSRRAIRQVFDQSRSISMRFVDHPGGA